MAEKPHSLHGKYKEQGFRLWRVASKETFSNSLCDLALGLAEKRFSNARVIPLEEAVEGSSLPKPDDKSVHAFYVKDNKRHPSYKDRKSIAPVDRQHRYTYREKDWFIS